MLAGSVAGLAVRGLYRDPVSVREAFRGGDLTLLVVAVPLLAGALFFSRRESTRAELVWTGLLAYSVYTYAYYVFDTAFNRLFLLHVAAFSLSIFAFALALSGLDVVAIGARFRVGAAVRWIAGYLVSLGLILLAMWGYYSLRFALTGELPVDVLPLPTARVHLGYTLDLALLVPGYALAGILLWRRTAWGYVLATVLCIFSTVFQLHFMSAMAFMARAHVPGVSGFDPAALPFAVAFFVASLLLLRSLDSAG